MLSIINKLFIDFQYQDARFREQTLLTDTPKNRKQLQTLVQRMDAKMLLGDFNYAEFFPGSKNLKKLQEATDFAEAAERAAADEVATPLFADFAGQWFAESKVQSPMA